MEKICERCIYRSGKPTVNGCDYLLLTGKIRGCPAGKGCKRFEEGKRLEDRVQEAVAPYPYSWPQADENEEPPPVRVPEEEREADEYIKSVKRRIRAEE